MKWHAEYSAVTPKFNKFLLVELEILEKGRISNEPSNYWFLVKFYQYSIANMKVFNDFFQIFVGEKPATCYQ